jgi:hypothetical protein
LEGLSKLSSSFALEFGWKVRFWIRIGARRGGNGLRRMAAQPRRRLANAADVRADGFAVRGPGHDEVAVVSRI